MNNRAFTLIEMMVILFILGMIATVVVPRISALEEGQEEHDFQRALLRIGAEARLLAIETGSTVRISYDDNNRVIELTNSIDETSQDEQLGSIELPENIEIATYMVNGDYVPATDWIVEYYADGSGTDCGLELEIGNYYYAVHIDGIEGAGYLLESLDEVTELEWEAGEIEQRLQ